MIAYSASEAKQNFAAMLDAAAKQPVIIRRHERDVAVVISPDEYARLHRLSVEKLRARVDRIGAAAEANGLTDEILAELLANRPPVAPRKPGIVDFLKEQHGAGRTREDIDAQVAQERDSWNT